MDTNNPIIGTSASCSLSCTWGRSPLPVSSAPQIGYLLIEARPVAPPPAPVPLNLCLVLDHSGSMQGNKLESMKSATRRVIDLLGPQDIVSLVLFDDTVEVALPATPATDKDALRAAVNTIEEAGGTAMSLGMQAGQAELAKHQDTSHLPVLLLLTDGQTWGDEDTCRQLARDLAQHNVRVTALGLGDEWNANLLDDIAEATGGTADYIADPRDISTFFQRTVQAAQGTALHDANLLLRLTRDITPRAVYRVTAPIANLGYTPLADGQVSVRLGDISADSAGSVVVELLLPSRTAGTFRLAQAELHATPVGAAAADVAKVDVLLAFTLDPDAPAYVAPVMNLVEKVTAFKLQTRALAEAEAGNTSAATQKLRAAATRLLDLGELELAETTRQQADQLEQGKGLAATAEKQLRYATRRLTQRLNEED